MYWIVEDIKVLDIWKQAWSTFFSYLTTRVWRSAEVLVIVLGFWKYIVSKLCCRAKEKATTQPYGCNNIWARVVLIVVECQHIWPFHSGLNGGGRKKMNFLNLSGIVITMMLIHADTCKQLSSTHSALFDRLILHNCDFKMAGNLKSR